MTQERGWGKGTSANPPLPAFVSVSRIVSQALGGNGTTKCLCQAYSMTSPPPARHWVLMSPGSVPTRILGWPPMCPSKDGTEQWACEPSHWTQL